MGDRNGNLVDPEEAIPDFGFAFNDRNFSDRILRIEIVAGDDEAADRGESILSDDGSNVLSVKTLHISSPILAQESPFFYKLFTNGVMESKQRYVTLRINNSEEAALMEVLRFMYCNTLTSKTTSSLLDVLKVADKFEATSCLAHCTRLLSSFPMTTESALLYLSLPSSVLTADEVKHLIDASKEFLVDRYKDISKCQDELLNFPLTGIEAILSSDRLDVTSEDEVYDFALKWTRAHYQKSKEQKKIFSRHLGPSIRFSYMTYKKLKNLITCDDFDHEFATKYLLDALIFKADAAHLRRIHIKEDSTSTTHRFIERAYKIRPIKIVEFEHPKRQSIVYLDLKHEECVKLSTSRRILSEYFYLGEHEFFLSADYHMDKANMTPRFGLYLCMRENGSSMLDVELECFARSKPREKYVSRGKLSYTLTKEDYCDFGYSDLFYMPWSSFVAEDCVYFINGVLHLKPF